MKRCTHNVTLWMLQHKGRSEKERGRRPTEAFAAMRTANRKDWEGGARGERTPGGNKTGRVGTVKTRGAKRGRGESEGSRVSPNHEQGGTAGVGIGGGKGKTAKVGGKKRTTEKDENDK